MISVIEFMCKAYCQRLFVLLFLKNLSSLQVSSSVDAQMRFKQSLANRSRKAASFICFELSQARFLFVFNFMKVPTKENIETVFSDFIDGFLSGKSSCVYIHINGIMILC